MKYDQIVRDLDLKESEVKRVNDMLVNTRAKATQLELEIQKKRKLTKDYKNVSMQMEQEL